MAYSEANSTKVIFELVQGASTVLIGHILQIYCIILSVHACDALNILRRPLLTKLFIAKDESNQPALMHNDTSYVKTYRMPHAAMPTYMELSK